MPTTGPRLLAAEALVARLQTLLADDELTAKVTATMNPNEVASGSTNGVVLVTLPTLSSPNFAQLDVEWQVHVIAGPPTNWLAAWDRIDTILQVLFDGQLNLATAEPSEYRALNGPSIPAYTITLNE
jgi:hypothetical protein